MTHDETVIRSKSRGSIRFAALLIALIAVWAAMLLWGLNSADREILEAVYIGDQRIPKYIARQVGHFGAPEAVMILVLGATLFLAVQGRYWSAALLPIATLLGHGLAVLQRVTVGRPRPAGLAGLDNLQAPSFPPSRVVDPMVAYLLVALLLTRGGRDSRLAVAAAVLIGASNGVVRVVLGHHWPSDSVAGWAFGALVALIAYWLTTLLPENRRTAVAFTSSSGREA